MGGREVCIECAMIVAFVVTVTSIPVAPHIGAAQYPCKLVFQESFINNKPLVFVAQHLL